MSNFLNRPISIQLKPHHKYALCLCGESKKFPMCDGSHRSGNKKPYKFILEKEETLNLCQCSKSKTLPHCDGSHLK
ncbi:CDGSH iron-sulfur domain-containing protein [Sulfurimonas sp. MAG313]|nr:CDGSH iron-sulfur domain-containing protein [Sulfurimonas sp. MAG313]MDF1881179.1 CDGSH iron-sulfur domain-containing protein [Sulfurimonas sp. MAG313]